VNLAVSEKWVTDNKKSIDNPYIDTFILKRYPTKEGEIPYGQEVNGFRSVKQSDSIIKYYGSYIHGDEYNILLEYADKGTLEDYFQKESPPSRGVDIIKFWESLFQLIKGLIAVHSVRE
jgi:serine/threonine protein kinase